MSNITFSQGGTFPLELHKVRVVQKLDLVPVERRLEAIQEAGFNTFLLQNRDIFLDMLTDSGVNAMSDRQTAAMMQADDSYAGSETFARLYKVVRDLFGKEFFLPTHQGRACENILAESFVQPGQHVPMNYHFTTTKAHIERRGGTIAELIPAAGLEAVSDCPFKGNMDIAALRSFIQEKGAENIAFVRIETGTNLIGGQPHSLENLLQVRDVCQEFNLLLVLDASLLADNLHFIKIREEACKHSSIREITRQLADACDIIYFSARKLGCARGGGICTNRRDLYEKMREFVTLFEGFLTYGGMSVREMEALAVGLEETMDEHMICQGPEFISFMAEELAKGGVPVVTPPGGLGCHINALQFLEHIPQQQYPAGALAAAIYLAGGVRTMERGTLSEARNPDGSEPLAQMELVRIAMPRRVFTLSQVKYAVDRILWLHKHRHKIGGLAFVEEPKVLRFFFGRLKALSDWPQILTTQFRQDLGNSL